MKRPGVPIGALRCANFLCEPAYLGPLRLLCSRRSGGRGCLADVACPGQVSGLECVSLHVEQPFTIACGICVEIYTSFIVMYSDRRFSRVFYHPFSSHVKMHFLRCSFESGQSLCCDVHSSIGRLRAILKNTCWARSTYSIYQRFAHKTGGPRNCAPILYCGESQRLAFVPTINCLLLDLSVYHASPSLLLASCVVWFGTGQTAQPLK